MIIRALCTISALVTITGFLLLFCLWWPHRRTRALSSIPWICLFLAFRGISPQWTQKVMDSLLVAIKTKPPHPDFSVLVSYFAGFSLALASLPFFVAALMLSINLAYLLQSAAPTHHPLQTFLAAKQRFQSLLGVLLLISGISPIVMTLYFSHLIAH